MNFNLGNIFSGLGSLMSIPNMLSAMDLLTTGAGVYGQIDSLFNPPKMPDFPRLDMQGNQPAPAPSPSSAGTAAAAPQPAGLSPAQQAARFASARGDLASRGVYEGGAFANPMASAPGMFNDSPETLYALLGQGQALGGSGFFGEEEESNYGPYAGGHF